MSQDKPASDPGVSRRGFLKGVGASSVATTLMTGALGESALAADPSQPVGPGETSIMLNINGQNKTVSVEPRTTLLDALRNRLDLTGAKKVCDRATCGACTVMKDGRPIYACTILAIEAQGSQLTTIEGLGTPEEMTPLQKAFIEHDGQQCGFCTPGFVMACTAVLKDHPNPSPQQVRGGLGGNLCRCGTYDGIKKAMQNAGKTGGA